MSSSGRGQVLVPWPNRIEDGSYEFDGAHQELPIDERRTQCAIHGLVRWAAWRPVERESHRVVLALDLDPQPGYPFSLALRIEYELSERGLRVTTTAANVGADRCPFGAGAHPYLSPGSASVDTAILHLPAGRILEANSRGIPVGSLPVDGTEFDFRNARPVGSTLLEVRQPRVPCHKLGLRMGDSRFPARFARAGRPGAYLAIIEPGEIAAGDRIEVVERPYHPVTIGLIAEVFAGDHGRRRELLAAPALPEGWLRWALRAA